VLGLIGLFLGIMAAVTSDSVGRIILFSAAGLFLLCMSLNLLFGPTTLCYLQTAVQMEFLPSIRRLRKARKILNLIRPLIKSAQGELAPEEIARRFSGMPGMPAQAAPQPGVTEAPPVIDPVPPAADAGADVPNVPPRIVS